MNFAIILSGGIGTRMRADGFPKQYVKVNDKPVLIYTLEKFQKCETVDQLVIVAAKQWQKQITDWLIEYHIEKFVKFALPGESRQESILSGLKVCMELSESREDKVIIHDAVRPLLSTKLIHRCFEQLELHDGCMPVLPIADTVYQSTDGREIMELLDRNTLFAGQAPEAFKLWEYWQINERATVEELKKTRGTSEIAYRCGLDVVMILGEDMNFKLTTPADMQRFEIIVEK